MAASGAEKAALKLSKRAREHFDALELRAQEAEKRGDDALSANSRLTRERDELRAWVAQLEIALAKQAQDADAAQYLAVMEERRNLAGDSIRLHAAKKELEKQELQVPAAQSENERKHDELVSWEAILRQQMAEIEGFVFDNTSLDGLTANALEKAFNAGKQSIAAEERSKADRASRELQACNKTLKQDEEHVSELSNKLQRYALTPSEWPKYKAMEAQRQMAAQAASKATPTTPASSRAAISRSVASTATQTILGCPAPSGELYSRHHMDYSLQVAFKQGAMEEFHAATCGWIQLADQRDDERLTRAFQIGRHIQEMLLFPNRKSATRVVNTGRFTTADLLPPPGIELSKQQRNYFEMVARGALSALGVDSKAQALQRNSGVKSAEQLTTLWASHSPSASHSE